MHLIQQMPFQSAQSLAAMFKPLRQQVFSSHIKKANALHWLFSSYSVVLVYCHKTIIRVNRPDGRSRGYSKNILAGQQSNRYYGYSRKCAAFFASIQKGFPSDSPVFDSGYLVEAALVAFVV